MAVAVNPVMQVFVACLLMFSSSSSSNSSSMYKSYTNVRGNVRAPYANTRAHSNIFH